MKWSEYIKKLCDGKPAVLFTTATTGLSTTDSEMLAFSYLKPDTGEHETLFRLVPVETLGKAAEYHKISKQIMQADGLIEKDWGDLVSGA